MNHPWSHPLQQTAERINRHFGVIPKVLFLGAARSGKSSLVESLFGIPRAAVRPTPLGTVVVSNKICGMEVVECPGYNSPTCSLEEAASIVLASQAHVTVHLLNGGGALTREDVELSQLFAGQRPHGDLTVVTKADLLDSEQVGEYLLEADCRLNGTGCLAVSAKTGTNLPTLAARLVHVLPLAVRERVECEQEEQEQSQHKKVQRIIYSTALLCAGVAATPVPFSDVVVMTPAQVAMIVAIGRCYGVVLSRAQAMDFLQGMGFAIGAGLLFRSAARGLHKLIPGAAVVDSTMAFAGTMALGRAAAHRFRANANHGQTARVYEDSFRQAARMFIDRSTPWEFSEAPFSIDADADEIPPNTGASPSA